MKKLLLFSDLHLRPESEDVCFQVLEDVLATAVKMHVNAIGFLGDFWHLRYQVPVHLLNRVSAWVAKVLQTGIPLYMLPGNHDQINELGENALQVFQEAGATVYSKPAWNEWGLWMPYRKGAEAVQKMLTGTVGLSGVRNNLFAHLPLQGALMNNCMTDTDGVPVPMFSEFSRVLLGHYHKRQSIGNATYIGSPWQTRADEYGQLKGYGLLEESQAISSFAPIDRLHGRRYHRVEATEDLAAAVFGGGASPGDVIMVNAPTEKALAQAVSLFNKEGFHNIVGSSKETSIPQPRFGFKKGTTITEYATAFAATKYPNATPGGAEQLSELMGVWKELLE